MVALIIMVIMSGVVMASMWPALSESRLRSSTSMVIGALRYARSYAVTHRTRAAVEFDIVESGVSVLIPETDENGDESWRVLTTQAGLYRLLPKGVVITDIVLPDEIIRAREETIKGKREAEKQFEQGGGYAKAIMAIQREFAKGIKDPDGNWAVEPQKISFEEARSIYERQRGFETIAAKPGNTHFVTPGIAGMQLAIGGEEKGANS